MKTYKIISGICFLLIIAGAAMQLFHIEIGISGRTVLLFTLLFQVLYQTWYISKLHKDGIK
jgi:hypothetical protein